MQHARSWKPSLQQTVKSFPTPPMSLTPATQTMPPDSAESFPKHPQTVDVAWYRVIVEVAAHDRLEPLSRFRNRIMPPHCQLLLDLLQLGSHALGYGLPLHS